MSFFTGRSPILSMKMPCGWIRYLSSLRPCLNRVTRRITLTPPAVEPAHPPTSIRVTSTPLASAGQASKSAVANPVVVRIEATWKLA